VLDDVDTDDDDVPDVVDFAAVVPPDVAAAATPAPAASPATATAPPIASLRNVPIDVRCGI
jgi:hypothetical protein